MPDPMTGAVTVSMIGPLITAAAVLTLAFTLAMFSLLRSDRATQRMLSGQLLGTNGVGLLLLLSLILDLPGLIDLALVLALLAAVAVIAFTRPTGDSHDT